MDWTAFLNYLAKYEGVRTSAYQDSVGVWTIGIGCIRHPDGTPVHKGDKITLEQAYEWAQKEAEGMLASIKALLKVPQTDEQLMALLSLAYNIGIGGLAKSSVLESINNKSDLNTIQTNWMKWNKGHVKGSLVELPALTTRRKSEFQVYSGKIKP